MGALEDRLPAVAAEAVSSCEALTWSGAVMGQLMQHQPRIVLNALSGLMDRLVKFQGRYAELTTVIPRPAGLRCDQLLSSVSAYQPRPRAASFP